MKQMMIPLWITLLVVLLVFSPLISAETGVEVGDSDDDGNQVFEGDSEQFENWCKTYPESCPTWLTANYNGDYAKTYFENKPEVSESNKDLFQRYLESGDSGDTYTDEETLANAKEYLTQQDFVATGEKDKTIAEKYCRSIHQGRTCDIDNAAGIKVDNDNYIFVEFKESSGTVRVPAVGQDATFKGEIDSSIVIWPNEEDRDQGFGILGHGTLTRGEVAYSVTEGEAAIFTFENEQLSRAEGKNWKIQGKLFTNRESDYIMAQPGVEDSDAQFNPPDTYPQIVFAKGIEFRFITEVNGKKYDVRGNGNYDAINFYEGNVESLTEVTIKDGKAYATDALSGTATRFENAPGSELRVVFGVEKGSDEEKALNGDVEAMKTFRGDSNNPIAIFTGTETVLMGNGKVTQKKGESDIAVEGRYENLYTRIEGQKVQLATTEEVSSREHGEKYVLATVNVDNQEFSFAKDNSVKTTQNDELKAPQQATQVSFFTEPLDTLGKDKDGHPTTGINDLNRMRVSVDPTSTTLFNDVTAWDEAQGKFVTQSSEPVTMKELDTWYPIDTAAGTSGAPEAAAVSADATTDEAEESEPAPDGETGAETHNSPEEVRAAWTTTEDDITTINYGLPDEIGLGEMYTDDALYIKHPGDRVYYLVEKHPSGRYLYTSFGSSSSPVYAAVFGGEQVFTALDDDAGSLIVVDPPTQEQRDEWKRQAQEKAVLTHASTTPPPDPAATAATVDAADPATHCAHPGPPCD